MLKCCMRPFPPNGLFPVNCLMPAGGRPSRRCDLASQGAPGHWHAGRDHPAQVRLHQVSRRIACVEDEGGAAWLGGGTVSGGLELTGQGTPGRSCAVKGDLAKHDNISTSTRPFVEPLV